MLPDDRYFQRVLKMGITVGEYTLSTPRAVMSPAGRVEPQGPGPSKKSQTVNEDRRVAAWQVTRGRHIGSIRFRLRE